MLALPPQISDQAAANMALTLVQNLAEAFAAAPDAATKARLFDIHGRQASAILNSQKGNS